MKPQKAHPPDTNVIHIKNITAPTSFSQSVEVFKAKNTPFPLVYIVKYMMLKFNQTYHFNSPKKELVFCVFERIWFEGNY